MYVVIVVVEYEVRRKTVVNLQLEEIKMKGQIALRPVKRKMYL